MRVLLTHDFFETFGGAERVTAEIAAVFPEAHVYAILGRRAVAARMGIADRVHALLPEQPRLLRHYRPLAPVYPAIVRLARLPRADLVLASSYAYAHGFRTPNRAPLLCYSHGPFRHLWSQEDAYAAHLSGGAPGRAAFRIYTQAARAADRAAARSVSRFVTQSPFTAGLIRDAYGRDSVILPPPVDGALFRPSGDPPGDYFLFVGRLVEAYKRPSLVVDAFAQMPEHTLLIAGDGPAMSELRRRATPNVVFLGELGDAELVSAMQGCRAAIFPSVDDFGLVPLEVAACGRPIIALPAGGPLHTVKPGVTGEFLAEQSAGAIVEQVRAFDAGRYDTAAIRAHATQWDRAEFARRIREQAQDVLAGRGGEPSGVAVPGPAPAAARAAH